MDSERSEHSKSIILETLMTRDNMDEGQIEAATRELMRIKQLKNKAYKDSKTKLLNSQERS